MPPKNLQVAVNPATGQPYQLRQDQVWVDQAGPGSIYYPKDILDFDRMTMQDYLSNFKGRIKFAFENRRFDCVRITGGQQVTKNTYKFFVTEQGKATATIDDGATAYTKDENDTNMVQAGQMEKGTAMLIDSVQIEVPLTHRGANTHTAGQPTTFAPSATDTNSASDILVGIQRTARFELWKSREMLWQGRLTDAPPEGGFSGVLGGSTPEGIVQNGFGFKKHLREVIVLAENYLFEVRMYWDRTVANVPLNTEIKVNLCGLEIRSVGGI